MVMSCCARGCSNTFKNSNKIAFHRFPKNDELKKKWVIALKRENFSPSASARLCGKHFKTTDYVVNFGQKKLTNNAVPTIFDFPEHMQKEECPYRSPLKRMKLMETEDCVTSFPTQEVDNFTQVIRSQTEGSTYTPEGCVTSFPTQEVDNFTQVIRSQTEGSTYTPENTPSTSNMNCRRATYFGEFKEKDLICPQKAKKMWRLAQSIIKKKQSTIKLLRNKTYRLQKQVKTLKDLLTHLKNEKRISDHCYSVVQECVPVSIQQILLKQKKVSSQRKYAEELRTFALTLNFYSNSAYKYIRKTFGNCLPHPKTLQKWYRSVDGSPGYTAESLRALEIKKKE